jgi:hypothetical protein
MTIEAMKLALEALEPVSTYGRVGSKDTDTAKAQQAITTLRRAIEQAQKQEPVAWLSKGGNGIWFHEPDASLNATPLYTSPPPRQPLTEEQWQEIAALTGCLRIEKRGRDAIMRIFDEAAHGIKGEA